MEEETTEHAGVTQPHDTQATEPLSERTVVSHATTPLQVPDVPPPPPPIPENYVPPSGNPSWKWILGSTAVVIVVLVAGAIGFTAGYGEGCPCDATRDARNSGATITAVQDTAVAVVRTADSQVLTSDANAIISSENELTVRETLVAVEGTSMALSTALFVNATSRATQQAVATSNLMTIEAAETHIFERDMQLTSVYATHTALVGTVEALQTRTPAPSVEVRPELDTTIGGPTLSAPLEGGTSRILPSPPNIGYPFVPAVEDMFFRDAWLHQGCAWQGMGGQVRFLPGNTQSGLQIRIQAPEISSRIVTIGTTPAYGEGGWEAKVADVPENQIVYRAQLYDNDGATPLSPIVEVRFNGVCEMNLFQLNFVQVGELGVG